MAADMNVFLCTREKRGIALLTCHHKSYLPVASQPEVFHVVWQGTDRDEQHLNIFLEFVPGGSIASLLTKFGVDMPLYILA